MKLLITALLSILTITCNAQRIFVAKNKSETKNHIYITRYLNQADLIVYKTSNINESRNIGNWFFVDAKSKCDWIICYVKHINEASLVIYFTDNKLISGYQPNKRKIQ